MRKYFIQTFGCAMNHSDSEKINMILLQSGFMKTDKMMEADLVIFNTCSVRQKGEDRVFGYVNRIDRENKRRAKKDVKPIIVGITGCMVRKTGMNKKYLETEDKRITPKKIEFIKDARGVFNNDDKLFPRLLNLDFTLRVEEIKYLAFILSNIYEEKIGKDDKYDDYLKLTQLRENDFQGTVVVQTGCDNFCTYCIVPYTRGREISRPKEEILEEIRKLAKEGVKEITLVGQNVNSYGKQSNKKFWDEEKSKWNEGLGISPFRELLNEIDKIEGIDRVRFTSSNPHDMTQDILDAHFELDKTCNYLHFALQSGSDEMLKRMNRRHGFGDFKRMVEYLRSKDPTFAISTDIIVGFSKETDEEFRMTYDAIKDLEIDFAYIARYSVRPGTIAAKIYVDDVPDEVKAERWHELNNLLAENVQKRFDLMIGTIGEILISGEKEGQFFGRTRNFKEVFFPKKEGIKVGDIVKVKILESDKWNLQGELV